MRKLVQAMVVVSLFSGCKKDEDDKKVVLNSSMRTPGVADLNLALQLNDNDALKQALFAGTMTANTNVTVTSFKVPIGRISLTYGDVGSGYTGTSPNFYVCATSNEACTIDLVNTSLENLLSSTDGSTSNEVTFNDVQTYTGIAVEVCAEGHGGEGSTFKAKLTATAVLGSTTYYTNATDGFSAQGPAEEVEIEMGCMGLNNDLIEPITVTPETTVDLQIWSDPTGAVLLTNDAELTNSNCTNATGTAFCVGYPQVFATVDAGEPTIERHFLAVQTSAGNNIPYANMLLTTIYDSQDRPFGAGVAQIYSNTEETKLLHSPFITFSDVTEENGLLTYFYGYDDTKAAILTDVPRSGAGTDLQMGDDLADAAITYDSSVVE